MTFELPENLIRDYCYFRGQRIHPIAVVCLIRCYRASGDVGGGVTQSILETIEDCFEKNRSNWRICHRLADSVDNGEQRRVEYLQNGPIEAAPDEPKEDPLNGINYKCRDNADGGANVGHDYDSTSGKPRPVREGCLVENSLQLQNLGNFC